MDSMDMNLSKLQEIAKDREAWCTTVHEAQRVGQDLANEQQMSTTWVPGRVPYSYLMLITFPTPDSNEINLVPSPPHKQLMIPKQGKAYGF